jgi:hypothetical protein
LTASLAQHLGRVAVDVLGQREHAAGLRERDRAQLSRPGVGRACCWWSDCSRSRCLSSAGAASSPGEPAQGAAGAGVQLRRQGARSRSGVPACGSPAAVAAHSPRAPGPARPGRSSGARRAGAQLGAGAQLAAGAVLDCGRQPQRRRTTAAPPVDPSGTQPRMYVAPVAELVDAPAFQAGGDTPEGPRPEKVRSRWPPCGFESHRAHVAYVVRRGSWCSFLVS